MKWSNCTTSYYSPIWGLSYNKNRQINIKSEYEYGK